MMTFETVLADLQYEIEVTGAAYEILKKDSRSDVPGSVFENKKTECLHHLMVLEKIYDVLQDHVVSKLSAWVTLESKNAGDLYSCSSCGMIYKDCSPYCPNCGKRMVDVS